MKNTFNVFKISLLFVFGLFLVGCGEDVPGTGGGGTGGGTTDTDPTLTLTTPATVTTDISTEFVVGVTAKKGTSPLKALYVYQGTEKLENARFSIDGTQATANPTLLFDADKTSFSKEIKIIAGGTAGEQAYRVVVADEANKSAEVKVVVTATGNPPTLNYSGSASFTVDAGVKRAINLSGEAGTADLYSMGIKENGAFLPIDRVFIGTDAVPSNPFGFPDAWKRSFEFKPAIVTPTQAGTYEYEVILTDASGLSTSKTFKMVVETGTQLDELTEYIVLLNSAGPAGTGGLDLDVTEASKAGVGSSDPKAEIRDIGIDVDKPAATNWKQRIAPVNGSELRRMIPGQNGLSESFTFAGLKYKEELVGLWDKGAQLSSGISDNVLPGHMFMVKRDGKLYALRVIEVNPTSAQGDNSDNYVFDLKR